MRRSLNGFALTLALAMGACVRSSRGVEYFTVASAYPGALEAFARAAVLKAEVIAAEDCTGLEGRGFLVVTRRSQARAEAESARSGDATIVECAIRPGSRLQFGVPAADPSMLAAPPDGVGEKERVSTIHPVAPESAIWVRRIYRPEADDPRGGVREQVLWFARPGEAAKRIAEDCGGATWASQDLWIAISCEAGIAGDHLFHRTLLVRRSTAETVQTVERCRAPKLDGVLVCQAESVSPDGELLLKEKRVPLPSV